MITPVIFLCASFLWLTLSINPIFVIMLSTITGPITGSGAGTGAATTLLSNYLTKVLVSMYFCGFWNTIFVILMMNWKLTGTAVTIMYRILETIIDTQPGLITNQQRELYIQYKNKSINMFNGYMTAGTQMFTLMQYSGPVTYINSFIQKQIRIMSHSFDYYIEKVQTRVPNNLKNELSNVMDSFVVENCNSTNVKRE